MAVDLSEFVPALRREVVPPGSDVFTAVDDETFLGYLSDGFWDARLDGFVTHWSTSDDGIVTPVAPVTTDIPRELIALVIVYAGIKIIRNQLLNMKASQHYKAGPVEVTTSSSAMVMSEMMRQLAATRDRFLQLALLQTYVTNVTMIDGYSIRQVNPYSYGGLYASVYGDVSNIATSIGAVGAGLDVQGTVI